MPNSFQNLVEIVEKYNKGGLEKITEAYHYAALKHQNQQRESGEPYITHPLAVAIILAKYNADTDTICAALLHDCLEDTDATYEEIENLFGSNVAMLVEGVTNLSKADFYDKQALDNANIRKVFKGTLKDVRIILIKIADRLHNMRTLNYKRSIEKQKAKSLETMEIYVPFAKILGIYDIKLELEDFCFLHLKPEEHRNISTLRYNLYNSYLNYQTELFSTIKRVLESNDIPVEVKFRMKGIYSTYKRLAAGMQYEEIPDLISIPIIVSDIEDCYKTLMYINKTFIPVDNGMRDLIAKPQGLYRAFHTNVIGPNNQLMQIQIESQKMYEINTTGIMSLWQSGPMENTLLQDNCDKIIEYISRIDNEAMDDQDFVELVKGDVLSKKIEVYDESNHLVELPAGATVLDFAYYLHSDIGDNTIAAEINGQYSDNLGYVLKPYDHIRIITDIKSKGPYDSWHYLVRTRRAKKKVNEGIKRKNN